LNVVVRSPELSFLAGGGETGALMRARDWADTPLGPPQTWPQPLKTLVGVMLGSRQPMFTAWGPERIMLYNDGYAELCRDRHPSALGSPFAEVWWDIIDDVGPILDAAYAGQATHMDDIMFMMLRDGRPQETHFSFSYTPVRDEAGAPAGVFCVCDETTEQVGAQRLTKLRADLGERLRGAEDPAEVMAVAAELLGRGLSVATAGYAEIDEAADRVRVERDWTAEGFRSLVGEHRLSDFPPDLIAVLRAGRLLRIDDLDSLPPEHRAIFEALDSRAFVNAPVVRDGRLLGELFVISREPRVWTDGEAALIEEFAARTWSAVHRRRAERALRHSQERVRLIQQAGRIGHFDWDMRAGVVHRSPEYLALQGLPADGPLVGPQDGSWLERVHPEDRDKLRAAFDEDLKRGGSFEREYRIVRADTGEVRWLLNRGRIDLGPDGEPVRLLSAQTDVTETKRAEAALAESEARFRSAADGSPALMWMSDENAEIVYANKRYRTFFGVDADAMLGDGWRSIVHPEDVDEFHAAFLKAFAAREPAHLTVRVIHPELGVRWLTCDGAPRYDPDGRFLGYVGVNIDVTDTVTATEALRESEERFRAAVRAVQGVLWTNDAEGRMTGEQPGWSALTGQAREQYEGYGWASAVHPEDAEASVQAWNEAVAERRTFVFEHRVRRADGRWGRYSIRAVPLIGDDGSVREWVGVHTDVTDLRQAEQALRESEENYRHAAELNPQVAWTATPDGQLDRVAERWREWTGTSGLGDTWGQGLHPDDLASTTEAWVRSVATGVPYDVEHRVKRVGGEYRWAHSRAFPRRDAQGAIIKWYGSTEDVHERKLAEAAVAESEARFRNVADHAPVMMWVTEPDGRCTYLNRGWYEFTGQTPAEAEGFGWLDATHPDDKADAERAFHEANAARAPFRVEYRLRRKDGTHRWVIDAASPRFGPDGAFLGYVGSVIDIDERREAEDRIRASEERFRTLTHAMPAFVWLAGQDGALHYFNDRWYEYTGQTPEEALPDGWAATLHPDDAERTARLWAEARAKGEFYEVECRYRRHDGAYRWYVARAEPVRDASGAITGWFGSSTDIHDRVEAEARLAASEARFQAIADSVDQMIWSTRPDGFHDYYNRRWYEFTGVPEGSTDGDEWNGMFHADDQDRAWAMWRHCLETGEPYHIEYRLRHRSGAYRWVLGRAQAVRDEAGRIVRWFGTCTDIQEIVEAREVLSRSREDLEVLIQERTAELAESERRFRAIFDTTFQLTGLGTLDGTILLVNKAALDAAGVTHEVVRGAKVWQAPWWAHSPHEAERVREAIPRVAAGEAVRYEAEMVLPGREVRTIDFSMKPVLGEDGEPAFLVAEGRDITEQKRAEESLRQSQKMEAVGQLTGGIAHDFNNLLTAVVGGLDMIQRRAPDDRTRRLASNALQAAERGAKLTGQLLAFSRTQRLAVEPVAINPAIEGMRELLASSLGGGVEVRTRLDPDAGSALTDANQFELAVLNLCINARDALGEGGGTITVSSACKTVAPGEAADLRAGDYVVIGVADDGPGMPPEVQARAFDPFFTTKPVGQGTGLGLSQVYGIALQSGGVARIDSTPGRGTRVCLWLPATRREQASEQGGADPTAMPDEGGLRGTVLVVDDDPDVRGFIVDTLDSLGFRVIEAADGPSGLKRFEEARPDLLVLDFAMPGMTGAEVAEAARRIAPEQPVLFVSGYADTAALERAAGDAPVLRKPFRVAEMAAAIEDALARA